VRKQRDAEREREREIEVWLERIVVGVL